MTGPVVLHLTAQVLVVAVVVLLPATLLLFTVRPRRHAGPLSAVSAVLGALGAALAALAVARVLDLTPAEAVVAAVGIGATVLAWFPAGRAWDVRGLVVWALTIDVGLLYLGYVATWTLTLHPGVWSTTLSGLLWLLELFVFVIGAGYLWEMVDVLGRRSWTELPVHGEAHPGVRRPFVSLHVPTHNEPPEMVIETLQRMLALDYEDYEILLVDNNTTDPALWRPVEEFCRDQDRITFIHLEDWPGYKSGALNFALTRTDPRAEVIGIVDADYHVDPEFLAHCAPLFTDPKVAFVQTPQDYRGRDVSAYFRRLYHSYSYFFDVSQRSRSERNGAIFGGTMGLIRLAALRAAGGWDEWCITEDAELSLRLLRAGGTGLHIDRSYGRGVMPLTFESLKRQRFRWCFGGVQILRLHWRSLLPGRRTPQNQLSMSQRWAYLVGGLQWFGDLAGLLFTLFLLVGASDMLVGSGVVVRRLSGVVLIAVVALVLLGGARSVALVRRSSGAGWRDALGAFGLWLALGLTVARASWLGLVSRQGTFLRTPKVKGEPRLLDALRGNCLETLIGVLCAALAVLVMALGGLADVAVGLLLTFQAVGFALAPVNSWAAIRSDLPAELRRRRGWLASWGSVTAPVARRGGLVLVGAAVLVGVFVAVAAPVGTPTLPNVPGQVADALDRTPSVHRHVRTAAPRAEDRASASARATGSRAGKVGPTTPDSALTATPTRGPAAPGGPTATTTGSGQRASATPTTRGSATVAPTTKPTSTATTKPTSAPTTTTKPGNGSQPTAKPSHAGGRPTDKPSQGGGKP